MPRFADVPIALRKHGLLGFARNLWVQIGEDNVLTWASACSYSWLLALFPFLIFLLTLVPHIPEQQKRQVISSLDEVVAKLPQQAGGMLHQYVEDTLRTPRGGLMSIGLLLALWAASGGMATTMAAIDRCYDVEEDRRFWVARPIAIVLTIVVSILMLLVVILLPIGGLVLNWLWDHGLERWGYHPPESLRLGIDIARWALGLFLLMIILNVVYHFGSRIRRRYRFVTPGAVFCVLTWILLGLGFRWYIDTIAAPGYSKTYGAVGGVIILLFLMYLAAIILLVGAEINSEIDHAVYPIHRGELDIRPAEKAVARKRREARRLRQKAGDGDEG